MDSHLFGILLPLSMSIAALAIGLIGSKGVEAIGRQPEASAKIQLSMILAIAFAEGLGVLTFILILMMINQ